MFHLRKGEVGYRSRLKRQYLIFTVILLVCVGIQLYVKQSFDERIQRILTISMLVTALPAALMLARLVSILKYKSLDAAAYSEYAAYEQNVSILYELLITSTDRILPMDVVAVHPTGGIYAYCSEAGIRVQKAEDEINETLQGQNLNFKMRISTDKKAFDKRMKSLKPAAEYEPNEKLEDVLAVLKAMSI